MANVYDPRPHQLMSASSKSSTSSENDILDDVFVYPGGKGAMMSNRSGFPSGKKIRTASEPITVAGKEISREDFLKGSGRTQALSDSSNVVKRGDEATGSVKMSTSNSCDKLKSSPILDGGETFPEPERIRREASKDFRFSALFEEDEAAEEGGAHALLHLPLNAGNGSPQFMDDIFVNEDAFDNGASGTFFEMNRNNATANAAPETLITNQPSAEDDDDDMFPEIEHFPSGYRCCAYEDLMFPPMDEPRLVMRSSFDGESGFPELPDDLMKEDTPCPEMDLTEVDVPELPALKLWLYQ